MSIRQRLYPDPGAAVVMLEHAQQARFVFNIGLEQRSMWTQQRRFYGQKVNVATQMRELTELRAALDWLRAGASVVQQGGLRDLDTAFRNFFAGRAGYPKFKKRSQTAGAFAVRDLSLRRINHKWGEVLIPKVGYVRFRVTRLWVEVEAATSARVSLRHGQWHVSFTTAPAGKLNPGTGAMVGIDRGVANTVTTSDGAMLQAPSLTLGEQTRFVALQRKLARQQRGSNRRATTVASLGRLRLRLTDRRTEWIEQTTTVLARQYDHVALEALQART